MDEDTELPILKTILAKLNAVQVAGVERAGRIESIHDTGKDTRERVINLEATLKAQDVPKRLDAHAENIRLLEKRLGRLESFFVVIGAVAGAFTALVVNWINRLWEK